MISLLALLALGQVQSSAIGEGVCVTLEGVVPDLMQSVEGIGGYCSLSGCTLTGNLKINPGTLTISGTQRGNCKFTGNVDSNYLYLQSCPLRISLDLAVDGTITDNIAANSCAFTIGNTDARFCGPGGTNYWRWDGANGFTASAGLAYVDIGGYYQCDNAALSDCFKVTTEGARVHTGPDTYFYESGTGQVDNTTNLNISSGPIQTAGAATGSLPTCNGAAAGSSDYDTTLSQQKDCDGVQWAARPAIVYQSAAVVGNGADTTTDDLMTYTLPAGLISANNRGIRVSAGGTAVSTTDVQTVSCSFGGGLLGTITMQASQINQWRFDMYVWRTTGASAEVAYAQAETYGNALTRTVTESAGAVNTASTIIVKCTGRRQTSSVANSVKQEFMLIELL